MELQTKQHLINSIKKLADNVLKQGIELKHLALSIESRKDEKTLKEWKEEIKPLIKKLEAERGYI